MTNPRASSAATPKRKPSNGGGAPRGREFHAVLVPIDLTASSDRVLGRVSLLPLAKDASLTILHVVPSSLPYTEQQRAKADARRVLAREVAHVRKQLRRGVDVEAIVTVGGPAKEIAASATKLRVDLIVVGRGGGRPLRDSFLGSTAERVVRQARLPVLVVRLPARSAYRRPALALDLDLDHFAHEVIRSLLHVLPRPSPRVEVIHAFDAPYGHLIYPSLPEDHAEERREELRFNATRKLAKVLDAALAKADVAPEDAPLWKPHVRYGSPRRVVEKAIKKSETDLLVLGTRGHSGAAHVFLGTVAGDLLRASKCDVLLVPPRRQLESHGARHRSRT